MPRRNIVARTWPNDYNIMQHPQCCVKNLTIFKFEPTTPNMSQHVATGWPNARNMLRPTMLGYVALNVAIVWPGLDVVVVWPGSCNNVASRHAH